MKISYHLYSKLWGVFICIILICCGSDDSQQIQTPPPTSDVQPVYSKDLHGTWILKGNSSIMAVVTFNLPSNLSYYGYWGNYSATYKLIEYELSNSNYEFKGWYSGGLTFNDGFSKGSTILIDKADMYMPEMKTNSIERNGAINRQHSFGRVFTIEALNDKKTKYRFSSGDIFFEVIKNTEYVSDYTSPTVGKSDFANLGLSVHWAKCNIGASKAEGYGTYAGWADPTGTKTSIDLADYPAAEYPDVPTTICGTSYDIAKQQWGEKWRMPTFEQMQELTYGCIKEEISVNGIRGMKYTGITGESIFLPCAGYRKGAEMINVGSDFAYWTGDIYSYGWDYAYGSFSGSRGGWYAKRYEGCQVRAVCNK